MISVKAVTNRKITKTIFYLLAVAIAFCCVEAAMNFFVDLSAYRDPNVVSTEIWTAVYRKALNNERLSEEDYSVIFSQTGLGKSAADKLIATNQAARLQDYYDYYTMDKDFECVREGIFANHEYITDSEGEMLTNPPFADIQDGDIIITLNIHSLGWRHGHAAIVTDAENGVTVQAVMMGEDSNYGSFEEWENFPCVAVLRAKNLSSGERKKIAEFAEDNLTGIKYSLFADAFKSPNIENLPETTHCANLVWYAFMQFGIDIDSDGGTVVTPNDILNSDNLEIVQIYGSIKG